MSWSGGGEVEAEGEGEGVVELNALDAEFVEEALLLLGGHVVDGFDGLDEGVH